MHSPRRAAPGREAPCPAGASGPPVRLRAEAGTPWCSGRALPARAAGVQGTAGAVSGGLADLRSSRPHPRSGAPAGSPGWGQQAPVASGCPHPHPVQLRPPPPGEGSPKTVGISRRHYRHEEGPARAPALPPRAGDGRGGCGGQAPAHPPASRAVAPSRHSGRARRPRVPSTLVQAGRMRQFLALIIKIEKKNPRKLYSIFSCKGYYST